MRLPLGDWGIEQVKRDVVSEHATHLLKSWGLVRISHTDLCSGLELAWLAYIQGHDIAETLSNQRAIIQDMRDTGHERAAKGLADPPGRGRPKSYRDHAFIYALHPIWATHDPKAKGIRAYDWRKGRDAGRFPRFCEEWLAKIDPRRRAGPPSRAVYENLARRLKQLPSELNA